MLWLASAALALSAAQPRATLPEAASAPGIGGLRSRDGSTPSLRAELLLAPPNSSVRSLLAAASYAAPAGPPPACDVLLAVHPAFEALAADTAEAMDAACALAPPGSSCAFFGANGRQFLPELLLSSYLGSHPCRTAWPDGAAEPPAAARSAQPLLFLAALPVRAISLLGPREAAPLRRRLWRLLAVLRESAPFNRWPERHVLLHTSTAKPRLLFGASLAPALSRGAITLAFEGPGGDTRPGAHRPTARSLAVPYFCEGAAHVSAALGALAAGRAPPVFAAAYERERAFAGPGARVFMRASTGKAYRPAGARRLVRGDAATVREALAAAFGADGGGSDVRLRARLDRQPAATQQAAFLATAAAMRNSTFCLVPRGITATSRRLYEALGSGCVPVLVSDAFALPLASQPRLAALWARAVLRQPEAELCALPARLAAIPPAAVRALREGGAALLPHLSYAQQGPGASEHVFAELRALALSGAGAGEGSAAMPPASAGPTAQLVPADLARATSSAGCLVIAVCSCAPPASARAPSGGPASSLGSSSGLLLRPAYALGQKRPTGVRECARWLRSLRRAGYAGPVAVLASARSSALRLALGAVEASGSDGNGSRALWLLDELETRLPRTPPGAPTGGARALSGNQLRLAWLARAMVPLSEAAPAARVLSVDARDLLFQAEPFAAFEKAAAQLGGDGRRCGLVFVADCRCAARSDRYFMAQGVRCLGARGLSAVGPTDPPLNGGVVLGTPALLLRLYTAAAALAAGQDEACRAMGRDQHLLTAAGHALLRQPALGACLLPNDAAAQAAVANLGVNNDLRGQYVLSAESGLVESAALREPIALLHQFDRRRAISAFLRPQMMRL